jgi:hypothetical protein
MVPACRQRSISLSVAAFFKPLANDRSLVPSGPSRRNMLGRLKVELTHSARGRAMAAICAQRQVDW